MKAQQIKKKNNSHPNTFIIYAKNWFRSNKQVTTRAKVKSIVISLVLGLVIAFGLMAITTKENPIPVLMTMIKVAIGPGMLDYTLGITGLLLLSALANAIAFRVGLFNFGVSGQMFFTGALTVVLGLSVFVKLGVLGLIILVWIGALTGGIITGFIGWLKAKFNVNEVVSSILLNWALFYMARYLIFIFPKHFHIMSDTGGTNVLPTEFQVDPSFYGIIILLTGLVATFVIAVLLWKSTFGHALKMTGLSSEAAKNAGINVHKKIIMAMVISGIISGILGVAFFVVQEKQIGTQYLGYNVLPSIGFEGIAIALLAYSNPLGIIPVALLFGILKSGAGGLVAYNIDNSFANLIIGIIMYFSAISVLFMRFKPLMLIYSWLFITKRRYPEEYAAIKNKTKQMYEEYDATSEQKKLDWQEELNLLTKNMNKIPKENTEEIKKAQLQIKMLKKDIKNIRKNRRKIKKYEKTQLQLFKLKKQQEFYDKTHEMIKIEKPSKKVEVEATTKVETEPTTKVGIEDKGGGT